jgi:Calx-beta domain
VRTTGILALVACLVVLGAPPAAGQKLAPPFDASYSAHSLGQPPGVPPNLGGLTLKAGTTDRLIVGGAANGSSGALYEFGLVRDGEGHITGFIGEAERFADAQYNDRGVAYGPGDVLFLARYPQLELGQTKPGSTITDKIIDLTDHDVSGSLGALTFVPSGQPGAGSLKLASYVGGQWYDAEVEPDGNGTYDLSRVTAVDGAVLSGPEGIAYVSPGSAEFSAPSVLVSEYGSGRVSAFEVNADGDPIVATRRDFVTGLSGAEGAFLDPLTGDFLFSTYGGGNQIIVVRGFAPPPSISVKTTVTNDNTGFLLPENFTVHVKDGGADVAGSPQQGSESGALYAVEAGKTYIVSVDPVVRYEVTIGGDCAPDGTVVVEEGVQPVCTVTADDEAPTAALNVISQVNGGRWLAEDFTVHVLEGGADLPGSPQPGSGGDGTRYALFAGTYTVSEEAARGYAATFGGDCTEDGTVTLADEQTKTCIITSTAVPLGSGVVIDGYGPFRTDGDWGIAESFLAPTRGYLLDPANFGPNGTISRAFQVAPGIRVANARTLDGVSIFFTGWVPGVSYTPEEKEALRQFVLGGGTLIATTDDTGHTMVDAFGLTQGDGGGSPTPNTITDLDHPIASGPFGTATSFNQYDATGHYPALGPNAHEIGRNAQGTSLAVIDAGALGPGSGAAIFVADVDVFSTSGGGTANETLIKNLFAFAAGERTLAVGDATQAEGNAGTTALTLTVTLPAPTTSTVRVHYSTADDTATAGSDYVAAAGDLEFAPGQTAKPVSIAVNGDGDVETDERFRLNLSSASGARLIDAQGIGTIANDDAATVVQAQQQPQEQELPPPEAGKNVNAVPKSGTVKVKVRGSKKFVELDDDQQIPLGSVLDTTKGRVTLVAASNKSGGTATADFYDGIFEVGQTKGAKPITTLELVEKLSCPKRGKANAAARKKKRRLWGDGSGKFRTDGEFSSATVRGTVWLVEDRCDTTLTKVKRGKVDVRDFVKRKTVVVSVGKQYVARRKR